MIRSPPPEQWDQPERHRSWFRPLPLAGSLALLVAVAGGCSTPGRGWSAHSVPGRSGIRENSDASFAIRRNSHEFRYQSNDLVVAAAKHYRAGQLMAARQMLRRARQIDPYCVAGLGLETSIALDLGETDEARLMCQANSAGHPRSAEVQNACGTLLLQLGSVCEGLLALERAVQLRPQETRYARDLAAAYVSRDNLPAAEMVLATAFESHTQDTTLTVALARVAEAEQRWEPAELYYTFAMHGDPANVIWRRQRARSRYRAGDYAGSAVDFAACQRDLSDRRFWLALAEYGDACRHTGDDHRSRQLFAEVDRHLANGLFRLQGSQGMFTAKR